MRSTRTGLNELTYDVTLLMIEICVRSVSRNLAETHTLLRKFEKIGHIEVLSTRSVPSAPYHVVNYGV